MANGGNRKRTTRGLAILAIDQLERMGLEPIAEIVEALNFAKAKAQAGGNVDENGKSDQSQFVALWLKSAETLAKFKYPTLSAIAVEALNDPENKKTLTTREAIEVIKGDPFAPKEIKEIPTDKIIDAMAESGKLLPALPKGKND